MRSTPTTQCPTCQKSLSADEIFCEQCSTINPMVRDFLENNPKPQPQDYQSINSKCPYCNKKQHSRIIDEFSFRKICTPIQYCKKCGGYFLQNKELEWSVIAPSYKSTKYLLTDLLFKNEQNIIEMLVDTPLICIAVSILYLLLNYPIGFLWLKLTLPKSIQHSNLRLQQNPDYPKILADMGYGGYLDERYRSLINYSPKTQTFKEFLKEAFTLD